MSRITLSPYELTANGSDGSNFMDTEQWDEFTDGGQGDFSDTGTEENTIVREDTPYKDVGKIWYGRSESDDDNSDGGWNWGGLSDGDIDDTKTYRYTVWMKQEFTSGSYYHGIRRVKNEGGNYVGNPYFGSGDLPSMNEWYLVVGYVYPDSKNLGNESGIYNINGEKVRNLSDYQWDLDGGIDSIAFRSYYYYDTNTDPRGIRFFDPRVEIVDGDHTPLSQLFNATKDFSNNRKKHWYDAFECQNLNRWDVNEANIESARSQLGRYSCRLVNPVTDDYQLRISPEADSIKPTKVEYVWQETSGDCGAGMRLRNSNGNFEMGISTDNPQWDIDDGNGIETTVASGGYDNWTRFTTTFDWNAGTFDVDLEQPATSTTYSDTGRPLKNSTDVEYVEFWDYSSVWGDGSCSGETWIDYVDVHY